VVDFFSGFCGEEGNRLCSRISILCFLVLHQKRHKDQENVTLLVKRTFETCSGAQFSGETAHKFLCLQVLSHKTLAMKYAFPASVYLYQHIK